MKRILIIIALLYGVEGMAQDSTDLSKLLQPYQFTLKKTADSSANKYTLYYIGNMPNAFTQKLPEPKYAGTNANGQHIYILPTDNMPVVKPDSSFVFRMPNAILQRK